MDMEDIIFFAVMFLSIGASILRAAQKKNGTKASPVGSAEPELMEEMEFSAPAEEEEAAGIAIPEEGVSSVHETAASRAGQWRKVENKPEQEPVVGEKRERHPVALDKEKLIVYSEIMKPKFDDF